MGAAHFSDFSENETKSSGNKIFEIGKIYNQGKWESAPTFSSVEGEAANRLFETGSPEEKQSYRHFMDFMTERPGADIWPAHCFPKPYSKRLPFSCRSLEPIPNAEEPGESEIGLAGPLQSNYRGTKFHAKSNGASEVSATSEHSEVGNSIGIKISESSGVLKECDNKTIAKSSDRVGIHGLCMNLEGLEEEELEEDEGGEVEFPAPPPNPAVELYPRPDKSLPGDTFFRAEHEYDAEETLAHSGLVPLGVGPSEEGDSSVKKPFPLNPDFLPHAAIWPEGEIILNSEPRIDTVLQGTMVADLDGELLDRLKRASAILSTSATQHPSDNQTEQICSVNIKANTKPAVSNQRSVYNPTSSPGSRSLRLDDDPGNHARIYTIQNQPFDIPCDSGNESEVSSGYYGESGSSYGSGGEDQTELAPPKTPTSRKRKIRRQRLAEKLRPRSDHPERTTNSTQAQISDSSSSSEEEEPDRKFLGHQEIVLERYRARVERYQNDPLSTNPFRNEHVGELPYCALRKWGVDLTMRKLQSAHRKVRKRRVLQRAVKIRNLKQKTYNDEQATSNTAVRTPWGNSPDRQFCAELIAQTNPVTLAMNHPFPWFEATDDAERLLRAQAESLAEDIAFVDGYILTPDHINGATNDLMEEFLLALLRLCRQELTQPAYQIAGITVSEGVTGSPTEPIKKRPDSFSPQEAMSAYMPVTPDTLYEDETWEHLYNEQARFDAADTCESETDEGFEDQSPLIRFGEPFEPQPDYHCAILSTIEKIEATNIKIPSKPDLHRGSAEIGACHINNSDLVNRGSRSNGPRKFSKKAAYQQKVVNERLHDIRRNLGDALSLGDSGIGSSAGEELEKIAEENTVYVAESSLQLDRSKGKILPTRQFLPNKNRKKSRKEYRFTREQVETARLFLDTCFQEDNDTGAYLRVTSLLDCGASRSIISRKNL